MANSYKKPQESNPYKPEFSDTRRMGGSVRNAAKKRLANLEKGYPIGANPGKVDKVVPERNPGWKLRRELQRRKSVEDILGVNRGAAHKKFNY